MDFPSNNELHMYYAKSLKYFEEFEGKCLFMN